MVQSCYSFDRPLLRTSQTRLRSMTPHISFLRIISAKSIYSLLSVFFHTHCTSKQTTNPGLIHLDLHSHNVQNNMPVLNPIAYDDATATFSSINNIYLTPETLSAVGAILALLAYPFMPPGPSWSCAMILNCASTFNLLFFHTYNTVEWLLRASFADTSFWVLPVTYLSYCINIPRFRRVLSSDQPPPRRVSGRRQPGILDESLSTCQNWNKISRHGFIHIALQLQTRHNMEHWYHHVCRHRLQVLGRVFYDSLLSVHHSSSKVVALDSRR